VAQYDATLKTYEAASIKISTSLAALNSGQNFIFSSALTMMMLLAAQGIIKGELILASRYADDNKLMDRYDDGWGSGHG
jgi:ABC-type transport system involved in Fe-S cluster assembly fused permease/ATPase subunit